MDATAAIELDRVGKRYGAGAHGAQALRDLSLSIHPGEFLAVTGPSGCGKSTLLNLVSGIDTPTRGRIAIAGDDLGRMTDDQRSRLRLRRMGFVFQSFNLLPTFTAEENVAWPLEFLGRSWREARRRARSALASVALPSDAGGRRPADLSGGEQQRVAIARALVTEPAILLADEPTGNLDSTTGGLILDLLARLHRECRLTVVLVTHSAAAAAYATRVIELRDGALVGDAHRGRVASARPSAQNA